MKAITTSALALVVGTALALTGCSNGTQDAGGKVTLTFWNALTGSDRAAVDETIKDFNASQPDITVQSTVIPGDVLQQKLLSSIASGDGPATVALDTANAAQYISAGALLPVDDFYSSGQLDTSKLVPTAVDATKVDGKHYGIPLNFFTEMLYWNKDLFAQAGITQPPATWDEFAADAQKLTKDTNGDGKPDQYAIALADHSTLAMYAPFLWNTGGGLVSADGKQATMNSPQSLQALNFWVDQVRTKHVSPIGLSGADADQLFTSGKAAMELVGPWAAPTLKSAGLNFGIARTFAGPTARTSLAGAEEFAIPKGTSDKEKQAVYKFAAYWNSHDAQAKYSSMTGFPPTRTDVVAADIKDNPYPAIFGAPDVVGESRVFMAGVTNGSSITTEAFEPALQSALNGKGTVDDLFQSANQKATDLLGK
ncbi:ABC transporter substrate-binding protein [Dactylosporangium sp. CA-092794]|uniref:ABC transporter substrate-binding protein n=1 Tax=Dactylosporangium sp. CA-092794 TaxID=3239929 RepID=UPI003D913CC4